MFMRPWKNRTTVTLAAMVLLLGLGLVTRTLAANQPEPASAEAASVLAAQEETGDFFRDFRAQRETARADEIALLDEIVKTVDFDARKELVSQMLDRAMELAIELPLYQRENLWAYNAVNVNMDTVPEATASWDHTDCLWQIEMN